MRFLITNIYIFSIINLFAATKVIFSQKKDQPVKVGLLYYILPSTI